MLGGGLLCSETPVPHSDAVCQVSFWLAEEVKVPLGFLHQGFGVMCPGRVLTVVDPQEFGAAHTLHHSTIDSQWEMMAVASPEVDDNLFGLVDI